MVLGLLALNAVVHRPVASPTPAGPSRPLAALVPTLVPDTPTPAVRAASPTARDPLTTPTVAPTATPPPQLVGQAAPPAPTVPPPTPTPEPVAPTPTPVP